MLSLNNFSQNFYLFFYKIKKVNYERIINLIINIRIRIININVPSRVTYHTIKENIHKFIKP